MPFSLLVGTLVHLSEILWVLLFSFGFNWVLWYKFGTQSEIFKVQEGYSLGTLVQVLLPNH